MRWSRPLFAVVVLLFALYAVNALRSNSKPARSKSGSILAAVSGAAIGHTPSLTDNGTTLVYAGAAETGRQLFVRNINAFDARALPGTEGVLSSLVSPDGKWIGFVTEKDQLEKMSIDGGAPTVLSDLHRDSDAAWAGNNYIITTGLERQGLQWLSANGGPLHPLTRIDALSDETHHIRPFVLPDASTVVFLLASDGAGSGPRVGELATVVFDSSETMPAVFTRLHVMARGVVGYHSGWLLYVAPEGDGVMAVALSADTRTLTGTPIRVLDEPAAGMDGGGVLAANGTLLYTRVSTDGKAALETIVVPSWLGDLRTRLRMGR